MVAARLTGAQPRLEQGESSPGLLPGVVKRVLRHCRTCAFTLVMPPGGAGSEAGGRGGLEAKSDPAVLLGVLVPAKLVMLRGGQRVAVEALERVRLVQRMAAPRPRTGG